MSGASPKKKKKGLNKIEENKHSESIFCVVECSKMWLGYSGVNVQYQFTWNFNKCLNRQQTELASVTFHLLVLEVSFILLIMQLWVTFRDLLSGQATDGQPWDASQCVLCETDWGWIQRLSTAHLPPQWWWMAILTTSFSCSWRQHTRLSGAVWYYVCWNVFVCTAGAQLFMCKRTCHHCVPSTWKREYPCWSV